MTMERDPQDAEIRKPEEVDAERGRRGHPEDTSLPESDQGGEDLDEAGGDEGP